MNNDPGCHWMSTEAEWQTDAMAAKRPPHFHYHNAFHALDVLPKIPIHH